MKIGSNNYIFDYLCPYLYWNIKKSRAIFPNEDKTKKIKDWWTPCCFNRLYKVRTKLKSTWLIMLLDYANAFWDDIEQFNTEQFLQKQKMTIDKFCVLCVLFYYFIF